MSLLNGVVEWTKEVFLPLGGWGLFLLAFIESSFFPIPPDILLVILALAEPTYALWFAAVCTVGSVLGGMFGYFLGNKFGLPLVEKIVSKKKISKVHRMFEKYEAWAIFIAGFSPIPYKVFTLAGGVFYINFKKFVIASVLSRGLRYFLLAGFIMLYGEVIVDFIDSYFELVTIGTIVVLIIGYYVYKKLKKKGMVGF